MLIMRKWCSQYHFEFVGFNGKTDHNNEKNLTEHILRLTWMKLCVIIYSYRVAGVYFQHTTARLFYFNLKVNWGIYLFQE